MSELANYTSSRIFFAAQILGISLKCSQNGGRFFFGKIFQFERKIKRIKCQLKWFVSLQRNNRLKVTVAIKMNANEVKIPLNIKQKQKEMPKLTVFRLKMFLLVFRSDAEGS